MRDRGAVWLGLVVVTLVTTAPAVAQHRLAPETRAMLIELLEGDRELTLAMIDSMPSRLLRFRPTPDVRDFAQQIEHVGLTAAAIVARFALDARPPALGDAGTTLATKAGLRRLTDAAFDYCIRQARELPDSVLLLPTRVFGREIPRWRVFLYVHSHDLWTLGQVVPYFRMNGMAPPAFGAF